MCAAGWGRIFTTRLTIMGLHHTKFKKCVSSFQDDQVTKLGLKKLLFS